MTFQLGLVATARAASLSLALLGASGAMAATAHSSLLEARPASGLSAQEYEVTPDYHYDYWTYDPKAPAPPSNNQVEGRAVYANRGNDLVTTHLTATDVFSRDAPTNEGTVFFLGDVKTRIPPDSSGARLQGLAAFGGSAWSYNFTADHDGVLKIDATTFAQATDNLGLTALNDLSTLGAWQAELFSGDGSELTQTLSRAFVSIVGNSPDIRASQHNMVSFDLAAGQTYTIKIISEETLLLQGARYLPAYDVLSDAHFDWSISDGDDGGVGSNAVPEPASWALMLGGFGAIGGVIRASKRNAAGAAYGSR